jgi:uncharacterized protein YndB with AHSA1/START domain
MDESLEVSTILPASPQQVYLAWLDSSEHGAFTGSTAEIDPQVGGKFTAWDGYIQGKTLEVEPYSRILQAWRTDDFPPGSPDSTLEVSLLEVDGGTQIKIKHSHIPEGQADNYREGCLDYYFSPMTVYFSTKHQKPD